jgi:4-diphosphocytidyl-2-C-methyl-D-erythritol kinase
VGSDVPFFLRGGTAYVSGRGEILHPLPDPLPCHVVLLTPPNAVERKTARLYGLLARGHYTDGGRTASLRSRLSASAPAAITEGDLFNVFESVMEDAFPGIGVYRERLRAATATPVHLCGAGPTLFALVPGEDAEGIAAGLRAAGMVAHAARVISARDACDVTETPR